MVAAGDKIHLAYTSGSEILYRTFALNTNPGTPPIDFVSDPTVLSGISVTRRFPSIAVGNTTPPKIFVAYLEQVDRTNEWWFSPPAAPCAYPKYCQCSPTDPCFWNRVVVGERVLGCGGLGQNWCLRFMSTDHADIGNAPLSTPASLASCSLAIGGSGRLELAWSEVWKNVPRTMLAHSANGASGSWFVSPLLSTPTLTTVDIAAGSGNSFRVAWSELASLTGHGPTFYNTGYWTGSAPTFPALSTPVTTGPVTGRAPQALFWSRPCKTGPGMCSIATVFEEKVGSTFGLKQDSICSPTARPACVTPLSRGCPAVE